MIFLQKNNDQQKSHRKAHGHSKHARSKNKIRNETSEQICSTGLHSNLFSFDFFIRHRIKTAPMLTRWRRDNSRFWCEINETKKTPRTIWFDFGSSLRDYLYFFPYYIPSITVIHRSVFRAISMWRIRWLIRVTVDFKRIDSYYVKKNSNWIIFLYI